MITFIEDRVQRISVEFWPGEHSHVKEVDAEVYGDFALHDSLGVPGMAVVTHLPTGLMVYEHRNEVYARAMAMRFNRCVAPWPFDYAQTHEYLEYRKSLIDNLHQEKKYIKEESCSKKNAPSAGKSSRRAVIEKHTVTPVPVRASGRRILSLSARGTSIRK